MSSDVIAAIRAGDFEIVPGVASVIAFPLASQAAEGPFSALAGSWSGGGMIKKSNGTPML